MKDTLQKAEGTEGQDTLKELKDEIKKSFLYAAQSKKKMQLYDYQVIAIYLTTC